MRIAAVALALFVLTGMPISPLFPPRTTHRGLDSPASPLGSSFGSLPTPLLRKSGSKPFPIASRGQLLGIHRILGHGIGGTGNR